MIPDRFAYIMFQNLVYLTANIFDDDSVKGSSGAPNRELVDVFSQPLNITPAPNLVEAKVHTEVLINEVRYEFFLNNKRFIWNGVS